MRTDENHAACLRGFSFRDPGPRLAVPDGVTTSGLVLTLDDDPAVRARLLSALAAEPSVVVGDAQGLHLPIATEVETPEAAEALAERLRDLDGVRFVDVVFVHFGPDTAPSSEEIDHGTT